MVGSGMEIKNADFNYPLHMWTIAPTALLAAISGLSAMDDGHYIIAYIMMLCSVLYIIVNLFASSENYRLIRYVNGAISFPVIACAAVYACSLARIIYNNPRFW